MKEAFNIIGAATAMALLMGGCVDFEPASVAGSSDTGNEEGTDDSGGLTDGADETGPGCGEDCVVPHELRGELMVFINGRLSSESSQFQSNIPLGEEGTFLGPALYLYDPVKECDDGTTACRLATLGHLRLDESLGAISVADGSLRKFTLQELAWSPDQGLWGVSFDVKNDEWGIARVDVDDWTTQSDVGVERFALVPGDAASPSTDPCYWQEGISGLSFLDNELFVGVRGIGGAGIPANGAVFHVALDVVQEQGHCVYDNDVSQDPEYYACDVLCEPWSQFEPQLGIAGDLAPDADLGQLLGVVRAENAEIMSLERQALYAIPTPAGGETSEPVPTGLAADGIQQGLDIEGLARIGGELYGIDVLGTVYIFDETGSSVTVHDQLGPYFDQPELSLRVRGATRVVVGE